MSGSKLEKELKKKIKINWKGIGLGKKGGEG